MPKVALEATVSTTKTVKLEPRVRRLLQTKLQEYFVKKQAIKRLEAEADKIKDTLESLREETGEATVTIEGYGTITLVAPMRKKFNEKRFVAAGGDLAIYNQSFDNVPSTPYTKVSPPGEKDAD